MLTTNLKRSVAALAVTAGLLVAGAGPASAAIYMKIDAMDAVVAVPAENTVPASKSLNTLAGDDAVKAKRAKAKHGKGKVAHGNQRTGAILNADMHFNQAETVSSN